MRDAYARRRDRMVAGLRALGFGVPHVPEGAFYVFADARAFSSDSRALAFDLLERAHVGTTPGVDFGAAGEGWLRFSYAASDATIEEALARLATRCPSCDEPARRRRSPRRADHERRERRRLPGAGPPEIAFLGRSNVGKSSLLNALVGRRALARTSSTPGKTRLLELVPRSCAAGASTGWSICPATAMRRSRRASARSGSAGSRVPRHPPHARARGAAPGPAPRSR
jgi:hypothetical protein